MTAPFRLAPAAARGGAVLPAAPGARVGGAAGARPAARGRRWRVALLRAAALAASGAAHAGAVVWVMSAGGPDSGAGAPAEAVTEVVLMSQAAFDAMLSPAPAVDSDPVTAPAKPMAPEGSAAPAAAAARGSDLAPSARRPALPDPSGAEGSPDTPPPAPPPAPTPPPPPAPQPLPAGPSGAPAPVGPAGPASGAEPGLPGSAASAPRLERPDPGRAPPPPAAAGTMRVARKPALPGPGAQAPQPGGEKAAAGPAVRTEAAAQGQSRGKDRAAAAPSAGLSEGESRAAMARWGGKLRARIDRAKSYPAGARASGRSGRVVLALTVSPAGRVLGVSVTASSGVPELDRAAVEAVRRAGRLPRAPQELAGAAYDFSLSIDFAL